MTQFTTVGTIYTPQDFNYHLYIAKKAKLDSEGPRSKRLAELLRNYISFRNNSDFSKEDLQYIHQILNQTYDRTQMQDGKIVTIPARGISLEELNNILVILQTHKQSLDDNIETILQNQEVRSLNDDPRKPIERLIAELKVAVDLMSNPYESVYISIGEAEQNQLQVALIDELNRCLHKAVNRIAVQAENAGFGAFRLLQIAFRDQCMYNKDPQTADITLLESLLTQFEPSRKGEEKFRAQLQNVITAHKENLELISTQNYLEQHITEARKERGSLDTELDTYLTKRKKYPASHYRFGLFSWCYNSFSLKQKSDAVDALKAALAGQKIDLKPHLAVLRNGELGSKLRAIIKAGDADDVVGKRCRTVSEFVAAINHDLAEPQQVRSLFSLK